MTSLPVSFLHPAVAISVKCNFEAVSPVPTANNIPVVKLPDTFNELLIVDAPETNKLVKFVLFNNDVDVAFKLLIDNIEFDDKLFKLLNIVVDVAFKLLIDNIEFDDKLFKLLNIVVDAAFIKTLSVIQQP